MSRMVLQTAFVIGALIVGLEAVHYRRALLAANVDRKEAWSTVVDLRHRMERCAPCADRASLEPASAPGTR